MKVDYSLSHSLTHPLYLNKSAHANDAEDALREAEQPKQTPKQWGVCLINAVNGMSSSGLPLQGKTNGEEVNCDNFM